MRRILFVVGGVLALLLQSASEPSFAQATRFQFRTRLQVTASDDFKDRLTSCLNRELRSLGDVELVDANPGYDLEVIAIQTKNMAGYFSGYALSYSVASVFPQSAWLFAVEPKYRAAFTTATANLYYSPLAWVEVGSNIDDLCKDVVAGVDTRAFEPDRKLYRSLQDMMNKKK